MYDKSNKKSLYNCNSLNSSLEMDPIVDKMTEEITQLEDRINEINIRFNKTQEEDSMLLENLINDLNKNESRINLLKDLLKSEDDQYIKEIYKKEEDRLNYENLIKEMENEILNLKHLSQNVFESNGFSNHQRIEDIFTNKNNNEELKNCEKMLQKLKEKRIFFEDQLILFKNKLNETEEIISMLKEERNDVQQELINLISHKESIEEIINMNNFSLFKNLNNVNNMSLDMTNMSINTMRGIELHFTEIFLIDKTRVINLLFDYLIDIFRFEMKNNYNTNIINKSNSQFIHKSLFENLIKNSIENYKQNNGIFSIEDFFILLTKKLFDLLYNTSTNELKIIIKELNLERLRVFLKYFFKIQYYEYVINNKVTFINRDYKIIKKENKKEKNEIIAKLNNLSIKSDKLETKENEIKSKMDSIFENNNRNYSSDYFNTNDEMKLTTLKRLDHKLNSLIELKNELKVEILNIKNNHKIKMRTYEDQYELIERINKELLRKKNETENNLEKIKISNNEEIIKIRNIIGDKYKKIKDYMKHNKEDNFIVKNVYKTGPIKMGHKKQISCVSTRSESYFNSNRNNCNNCNNINNFSNENNKNDEDEKETRILQIKDRPQRYKSNEFSSRYHSKSPDKINNLTNIEKNELLKNKINNLKKEIKNNTVNNSIITIEPITEIDPKISEKINPLLEGSLCYKKIHKGKNRIKEFDPFINIDNIPEDFGFTQNYIYLNKSYDKIIFFNSKSTKNSMSSLNISLMDDNYLNVDDVDKTVVNKSTKIIINFYQLIRKLKRNKIEMENYFIENNTEFNDKEKRNKLMTNKYFNFTLKLFNEEDVTFELIFLNFEDFKKWLNGFAFIIKNKELLLNIIK